MKPEVCASQHLKALCLTFTLMYLLRMRAIIFLVECKFFYFTMPKSPTHRPRQSNLLFEKNEEIWIVPSSQPHWDSPGLQQNNETFRIVDRCKSRVVSQSRAAIQSVSCGRQKTSDFSQSFLKTIARAPSNHHRQTLRCRSRMFGRSWNLAPGVIFGGFTKTAQVFIVPMPFLPFLSRNSEEKLSVTRGGGILGSQPGFEYNFFSGSTQWRRFFVRCLAPLNWRRLKRSGPANCQEKLFVASWQIFGFVVRLVWRLAAGLLEYFYWLNSKRHMLSYTVILLKSKSIDFSLKYVFFFLTTEKNPPV